MNVDFCDKPDLMAITGSRLYGTATPKSDIDYRGVVAEPEEFLIGMHNFEQKEYPEEDKVVYGLKKFFNIVSKGNTNCFEMLFATAYPCITEIGQFILENKNIFCSKAYYRSIRGFALCEYRKARAVNLTMQYEDEESEELFVQLTGRYNLKRFEINEIMDIIFESREGDPRKETPSTRFLGKQRKESYEKHGYGLKNAYHAIRLLDQGIELLQTGTLVFPRPNADELRAIRNGEKTLAEIEERFNILDKKLCEAAEKSTLPVRANLEKVNKVYVECVRMKLNNNVKI